MTDPMAIYVAKGKVGSGSGTRMLREWMRTVEVGDVLRNTEGTLRVVRHVRRLANGTLCSVTFAIRRCSWTGRGHTIYSFTELRMQGWCPVGVRLPLDGELDAALEYDIVNGAVTKLVTCCIAKDMP
jgi:hypothetical protein